MEVTLTESFPFPHPSNEVYFEKFLLFFRLRLFNLKTAVDEEPSDISMDYMVLVGANSFAHNLLSVRMNSHLRPRQLRFLGLLCMVK